MPFYYAIKRAPDEVRKRTAEGLLRLRSQLSQEVPPRTISEKLLLATWNIREFDSPKYGERTAEPFHYIAEIISHFDLVAIQEVREDLAALDRVQEMLGGWWKYIVTDVTYGASGNGERMAFMYDSRKVTFGGLAGEVVLPDVRGRDRSLQFARTPFLCGFKASWTKFNLCTVHIYYGESEADDPRRVREIEDLARLLADKAKSPSEQPARPDGKVTAVRNISPENLILLGDFNIFARGDRTFAGLTKAGFVVPDSLQKLPGSNLDQSKYYDQIAFLVRPDRFGTDCKAGVFNFCKSVYRDEDEAVYGPTIGEPYARARNKRNYYRQWRTFQMSDHLLLWVELKIDFGTEYLEKMRDLSAAGGAGG